MDMELFIKVLITYMILAFFGIIPAAMFASEALAGFLFFSGLLAACASVIACIWD